MVSNVMLVFLSFFASVGFGILFRIRGRDLIWAGIAGMLTRIVLLILLAFLSNRLLYMTIAASFAGLYGEFLATVRKEPSTYFIYPAIVTLIPGDLFCYTMIGLFFGRTDMLIQNGVQCLLALAGLSVGFVLSSTAAHYIRCQKKRL